MEKIEINIVQVIGTRMALHEFGVPVRELLHKRLQHINQPTLFLIDLRKTNPLDYEFVNISFKEIINEYLTNNNIYIAFKVDKWEFQELCTGILDILQQKNNIGITEKETLTQHLSLVYLDEDDQTQYISTLLGKGSDVLAEIERHSSISSTEIQETFHLIPLQ